MTTVVGMVREWLEQHGYDGLCNDEPCGCGLEDLFPCAACSFPTLCVAARRGTDGLFYPASGRPSEQTDDLEVNHENEAEHNR